MTGSREPTGLAAIVCGSDTLVGSAVVSRLHDAGWHVLTVDPPGAAPHPAAALRLNGDISDASFWAEVQVHIHASGNRPRVFVHAVSGFDGSPSMGRRGADGAFAHLVRSAELGCKTLMPSLNDGQVAVVLLTSVLAYWDTRVGGEAFAASQAGLLGLMRSAAVSGGPAGIRVNAVCMGLVANPREGSHALPAEVRGRIPLGRAATPDDVADAVLFLLSPDARHVSGSTLVVDGGQSLQSWSNTPREGGYPLTAPAADSGPSAPPRFQGRTVLITGAAGGIGSAAAHRFAAEGASLALLDRDGAAVQRLAARLAAQGHDMLALEADVTDEAAMEVAIARAEEHLGHLHVLFNNAGVGGLDLSVVDTPVEKWDDTIDINLRGVFLGCKYGVPALIRAGGGAIVNMGSSTGRHDTIPGSAAYMASKAAVEALTKSLALQVAPHGIRANTICPGIIQTELSFRQQERGDAERFFAGFAARIPLGRVGQPEDVAAAVAFLASDQARHITGAALLIDGGQTLRRWVSAPDLDFGKGTPE